jgi:FkbM family methyltransferase
MKRWLTNKVCGLPGKRGIVITRPRFHEEQEIDLRAMLADRVGGHGPGFVVVQIGANDGVTLDPIHHLVKSRDWTLLAIEPLPGPFERLKKNYGDCPHVHCLQCAISHSDGEAEIYTLQPTSENCTDDILSSLSEDVLRKHWRGVSDLEKRIVTQRVRTRRLASVLRDFNLFQIDMLQVDTEGFDYQIVKMSFSERIYPLILAFEWVNLTQREMWECRCDLITHGYRWLVVKGDVVAVREHQG